MSDMRQLIDESLLTIPKFGEGVGLHRMSWLMQRIQSEHPCAFKAIKITGSNGKGSVSALLSSMMEQMNLTHGLYTSPHLFKFNERIRFGSQQVDDDELIQSIHWFLEQLELFNQEFVNDRIGAFEAFTAIALHVFAKRNIEYMVIEAGIGGRFDSTRLIPGRIVALTSLDLEHSNLLGNSLELIAYDKIDLCPANGSLIVGSLDAWLKKRLATYCSINSIHMLPATMRCKVLEARFEAMRMRLDMEVDGIFYKDVVINLVGQHQQRNAEVAITTLLTFLDQYPSLKLTQAELEQVIRRGLETVVWHGRCSLIETDPNVYIDVGHSPRAVAAAIDCFKEALAGKRILLVAGVSYDKDVLGILRQIIPIADEIIATRAHHKGSKVDDIYKIVQQEAPGKPVIKAETIELAVQMATERARAQNMEVVILGGLFLSIEAETALKGKNPKELRFF